MPKLQVYDKSLDYAYAPGMFPATECLNNARERCMRLLLSTKTQGSEGAARLKADAEAAGVRTEYADRVLEKISHKENCFAAMVYRKVEGTFGEGAHLVLHTPSDSGNLGTMLRTALGFGYPNVAIIGNGVDSDDPRVVRASMGAAFSLHIRHFARMEDYLEEFPERQLYLFMLTGSVSLSSAVQQKREPFSLVFGNEATGLPDEYAALGCPVRIPHSSRIDSLNLSVAAGIGMYAFAQTKEATCVD